MKLKNRPPARVVRSLRRSEADPMPGDEPKCKQCGAALVIKLNKMGAPFPFCPKGCVSARSKFKAAAAARAAAGAPPLPKGRPHKAAPPAPVSLPPPQPVPPPPAPAPPKKKGFFDGW